MLRRLLVAAVAAVVSVSAVAQRAADALDAPETGAAGRDRDSGADTAADAAAEPPTPSTPPGRFRASLGARGLEIAPADGRYTLELGGRLHVDWARHSGDTGPRAPADGADLRRARIAVGARLDEPWRFFGEVDFAGDDVAVTDLSVAYEVDDRLRVTLGQQKQPYSLGLEMSSNDIPFVERGIDNALVAPFVGRALGIRLDASGRRWFAAGGVYGEPIDDDGEGWGTAVRFVVAPVADADVALHVGIRAAYREPAADASTRIRDETTSFSDLSIVDTAPIAGVDGVTLYGPEAAFAAGPFSVFGEYSRARIEHALGTSSFDAWHVAATWSLTGESRAAAYDVADGEFKRLEPRATFSPGNARGAWELAVRYASIDLNDELLTGGMENAISLAANWYPHPRVRAMFDWTRILDTDASNETRAAAEGLDVVTVRTQWAF